MEIMEMEHKTSNESTEERGKQTQKWVELLLRVMGLILSLVSAVVLGVNKQTKEVPVSLSPSLPTVYVPVTAKWTYLSAFIYFVVANSIASIYAALSLLASLRNKYGRKSGKLILTIRFMDMAMVALLFSSIGSAAEVGVLGYKGNSHVKWNKVCNIVDKFCRQAVAAIVVSLLGSISFVFLVLLAAFNLHVEDK